MSTALDAILVEGFKGTTMSKSEKSNSKLIIAGGILLLAATTAGGAYLYSNNESSLGSNSTRVQPPSFVNGDPYVVNLADQSDERYLQVSVVYEVKGEEVAEALRTIAPMIRSRTLIVLSKKQSDMLKSPEGKQLLKEELLDLAQVSLSDSGYGNLQGRISDTHFGTFVIQ